MKKKSVAALLGFVFTSAAIAGNGPILPSQSSTKKAAAIAPVTTPASATGTATATGSAPEAVTTKSTSNLDPSASAASTPALDAASNASQQKPGKAVRKVSTARSSRVYGAGREAKPISTDSRVRQIVYDANKVVAVRAAYGYTVMVEFGEDEIIQHLSLGDTVAWQAIPRRNNLLFLKPQEDNPETNLIVVTNKRSYTFSLVGIRTRNFSDPRLTYRIKFHYPEEEMRRAQEEIAAMRTREAMLRRTDAAATVGASYTPTGPVRRASNPAEWNFKYSFKGSRIAAPIKMFDDGQFTYIQFANYDNIPAMFLVDSDKKETLLSYRREGEWIVIERLARQLTFRANNNSDVTCIFNDAFPTRPNSSLVNRNASLSSSFESN